MAHQGDGFVADAQLALAQPIFNNNQIHDLVDALPSLFRSDNGASNISLQSILPNTKVVFNGSSSSSSEPATDPNDLIENPAAREQQPERISIPEATQSGPISETLVSVDARIQQLISDLDLTGDGQQQQLNFAPEPLMPPVPETFSPPQPEPPSPPLPEQPARVGELIAALDDPRFSVRESAERDLVRLGTAALPQLALRTAGSDSEGRRRAEQAIAKILAAPTLSNQQLLSLRDQTERQNLITAGTNGPLTAAQRQLINDTLDGAITRQFANANLIHPTNIATLLSNFGEANSMEALDLMASGGGALMDTQRRLQQLTQLGNLQHLTGQERASIDHQIYGLNQLLDPEHIDYGRVLARARSAAQIRANNPPGVGEDLVQQLLTEATQIGVAPRVVQNTILDLDLDRNPDFVNRFVDAGGNRRELKERRQRRDA